MRLLLNADLGEIDDPILGIENRVMPYLDMANVACGGHAGDIRSMAGTLAIAARHGVAVGAHPSYEDRQNFGRISRPQDRDALTRLVRRQLDALDLQAARAGLEVSYIKPHGALYNDMMANREIRFTLLSLLAKRPSPVRLMLLATADALRHREEAQRFGVELLFETFADRCYADDGFLLPRGFAGAVHDEQRALEQVRQLCEDGTVTSSGGKRIAIDAQTLCIHGDSPDSVAAIAAIHRLVHQQR
ncbi:MAG: 5-oxoprolinase subunit PxpA [Porticoccaceae bacterium]